LIFVGALTQTPLRELLAPSDPLAVFKGAYFKRQGRGERKTTGKKWEKEGEKAGEEKKGKRSRVSPPLHSAILL